MKTTEKSCLNDIYYRKKYLQILRLINSLCTSCSKETKEKIGNTILEALEEEKKFKDDMDTQIWDTKTL